MKKFALFVFAALFAAVSLAATETINGVTYTYSISNGKATIGSSVVGGAAIPHETSDALVIPSTLGGCPVTTIGDYAFCGCNSLTSVKIPEGVTTIGDGAFDCCDGLTSVTIPEGVTTIGWDAFSFCDGLMSVTIPSSVTTIEGRAFYYCSSLTSVTIPEGVTTIEEMTFDGCSSLTTVHVDAGDAARVKDLMRGKGVNVDKLIFVEPKLPDGGPYTETVDGVEWKFSISNGEATIGLGDLEAAIPTSTSGAITIPSTLGGWPVTTIGEAAFYNCSSLTSVTIPDSVKTIGLNAFRGCSSLTSVTIPESVTAIGGGAFNGTPFYNNKPDGLVVLGSILYKYKGTCPASVIIPNGVTTIGDSAFWYSKSLTSITIPDSVTTIGEGAFSGCSSLTSVTIPESVTAIGRGAFDGTPFYNNKPNGLVVLGSVLYEYKGTCPASVIIPNGVVTIGSRAFYYCRSLTSVTIPNSVTTIGESAFYYCSSLKSVTIPNSVTTISGDAFLECGSLKSINVSALSESYCSIEGVLYSKDMKRLVACPNGMTSVIMPDGVTTIGDYAFCGCSSLTSVTIPNSVTTIGDEAFDGCSSLTSITIPNGVTTIGDYAFGCTSIDSIVIPDSVQTIGIDIFYGCMSLKSVTFQGIVKEFGKWMFHYNEPVEEIIGWQPGISLVGIKDGSLKRIVVLNGVTEINSVNSSSLTSITIPSSVTKIGRSAFINCKSLKRVDVFNLSAWLKTTIEPEVGSPLCNGADLYVNGEKLVDLVIPSDITSIGNFAFYGCTSIRTVTIHAGVKSIGDLAFDGCVSLTESKVDAGNQYFKAENKCLLTYDGKRLVAGCNAESVIIPDTVEQIWGAFSGFDKIKNLTIQSRIWFGPGEFHGCTSLENVFITDLSKWCGSSADAWGDPCEFAKHIYVNGIKAIDVVIPIGVTELNERAFAFWRELESITIPASVTSIVDGAFRECISLKTVYVDWDDADRIKELMRGKGVDVDKLKFVEPYAYEDMPKLRSLYGDMTPGKAIEPIDFLFAADCKVSGLPSGLKVVKTTDKKTKEVLSNVISGTPKAPGLYTVKLTKTVNKVKYEYLTTFEVANYKDANNCFKDEFFTAEDSGNNPGKAVTLYQGVADISAMPKFDYIADVTKLTVSGLPTGLKYDAKTGSLTGIPTKVGNFTVMLTATKGKSKLVSSFFVKVETLPSWAVGTFNGGYLDEADHPVGMSTLTITATGKISGKVLTDGLTWTLSATGFDSVDESGAYHATLTAKLGNVTKALTVVVDEEGVVGSGIFACLNRWKTPDLAALGKELAVLTKNGYVTDDEIVLKIAASGAVTATKTFDLGTDAKGNAVLYKASCSTTLIPMEGEDYTHIVFVYFAPNVKKGFEGFSTCLFLMLEDEAYIELAIGESIPEEGSSDFGTVTLSLGKTVNWELTAEALTATTIAAAGLPSGLKLVLDKQTKAYSIQGVPNKLSKFDSQYNAIPSLVKFTVTSAGKNSRVFTMKIVVVP